MYKNSLLESSPMEYWSRKYRYNEPTVANTPILLKYPPWGTSVKSSVDEVQDKVLFSHFVTPCIHPTFTILLPSCLKKAPQGRRVHAQSAELHHWIRQLTAEF